MKRFRLHIILQNRHKLYSIVAVLLLVMFVNIVLPPNLILNMNPGNSNVSVSFFEIKENEVHDVAGLIETLSEDKISYIKPVCGVPLVDLYVKNIHTPPPERA